MNSLKDKYHHQRLKGGNKLFHDFQMTNKNTFQISKFLKQQPDDVVFSLKLKQLSSQFTTNNIFLTEKERDDLKKQLKQKNKDMINQMFIKSLEQSYATLYLENILQKSNSKNIRLILERHPLEQCFFATAGWDNVTEMVDTLQIYPHRKSNVDSNFEHFLRNILFNQQVTSEFDSISRDVRKEKSNNLLSMEDVLKKEKDQYQSIIESKDEKKDLLKKTQIDEQFGGAQYNSKFKQNLNDQISLDKLKKEIKIQQVENIWNKIFKPDPVLGKLGILQQWKNKYLYPFGDIAPISDFDEGLILKQILNKDNESSIDSEIMLDDEKNQLFENLISQKYRIQTEDMGGFHKCSHWIEELKNPIQLSQDDVSKDLYRFAHAFPIEFIPYKTENQHKIENMSRKITKVQIEKHKLSKDIQELEAKQKSIQINKQDNLSETNSTFQAQAEKQSFSVKSLNFQSQSNFNQSNGLHTQRLNVSIFDQKNEANEEPLQKNYQQKLQKMEQLTLQEQNLQKRIYQTKVIRRVDAQKKLSQWKQSVQTDQSKEDNKVQSQMIEEQTRKEAQNFLKEQQKNSEIHYIKQKIDESKINYTFEYIKDEKVSKLVGTLAHFVYWCVFGEYNDLQIDTYHMKVMFKHILQQVKSIHQDVVNQQMRISIFFKENPQLSKQLEISTILKETSKLNYNISKHEDPEKKIMIEIATNNANKFFHTFMMPVLLLTIRLEIDIIFQTSYNKFFGNIGPSGNEQRVIQLNKNQSNLPFHLQKAQRLMNGVISELLDPNLFYSRLSFLESGKEALDIKDELNHGKRVGFQAYKLPSLSNKFYTRSSIIRNILKDSTEGIIRAKFSDNLNEFNFNLNKTVKVQRLVDQKKENDKAQYFKQKQMPLTSRNNYQINIIENFSSEIQKQESKKQTKFMHKSIDNFTDLHVQNKYGFQTLIERIGSKKLEADDSKQNQIIIENQKVSNLLKKKSDQPLNIQEMDQYEFIYKKGIRSQGDREKILSQKSLHQVKHRNNLILPKKDNLNLQSLNLKQSAFNYDQSTEQESSQNVNIYRSQLAQQDSHNTHQGDFDFGSSTISSTKIFKNEIQKMSPAEVDNSSTPNNIQMQFENCNLKEEYQNLKTFNFRTVLPQNDSLIISSEEHGDDGQKLIKLSNKQRSESFKKLFNLESFRKFPANYAQYSTGLSFDFKQSSFFNQVQQTNQKESENLKDNFDHLKDQKQNTQFKFKKLRIPYQQK